MVPRNRSSTRSGSCPTSSGRSDRDRTRSPTKGDNTLATQVTSTTAAVQKPPAGFPAPDEVRRLYDEADLNRAVQAYRFFYPTVSGAAIFRGNTEAGLVENKVFGVL